MQRYEKKITADRAWLRPVASETRLMRIAGHVTEGWAETSPLGQYVRWSGTFRADMEAKPDGNGVVSDEIVTIGSTRLILPAIAANWLGLYFDGARVDGAANPADSETRSRTGEKFTPKEGVAGGVNFVIELTLRPPKAGKPSQTGYEFGLDVLASDNRFNPLTDLDALMANLPPLIAGKVTDTPPKDDDEAMPSMPALGLAAVKREKRKGA